MGQGPQENWLDVLYTRDKAEKAHIHAGGDTAARSPRKAHQGHSDPRWGGNTKARLLPEEQGV